jgi:hypothetical protein
MREFSFNIDAAGVLRLFDGVNAEPFVIQPNWPNGQAWADGEAEAWAEQLILALTDVDADDAGDSPDAPTKPKYVDEIIELKQTKSPE